MTGAFLEGLQERIGGELTDARAHAPANLLSAEKYDRTRVLRAELDGVRVEVVSPIVSLGRDTVDATRGDHQDQHVVAAFAPGATVSTVLAPVAIGGYGAFHFAGLGAAVWTLADPTPWTSKGLVAISSGYETEAQLRTRSEALGLSSSSGFSFDRCADGVVYASARTDAPDPQAAIEVLRVLVRISRQAWRPLNAAEIADLQARGKAIRNKILAIVLPIAALAIAALVLAALGVVRCG